MSRKKWGISRSIESFPTFECASAAVKEQRIDAFLVPGAYPQSSTFIMDDLLLASHVFIMGIPSLVLAVASPEIPDSLDVIYHHPATTALLSEIEIDYKKSIQTSSNTQSCRQMLNGPHHCACITNSLCSTHFNLNVIKILRKEISMPWICFKKSNSTE